MIELYIYYFLTLCEVHPELLHSDANRVFRVIHIEEAFSDFRKEAAEKGYIFRLILPTYRFADQGSNGRRQMQCGFVLANYFNQRTEGSDAFIRALENCRKVADDFFVKMVEDSRAGFPLFGYAANKASDLNWSTQTLNATGDGSYAGLLITFEIEEQISICIEDHPDATWRQPTPLPSNFFLTADNSFQLAADGSKISLS